MSSIYGAILDQVVLNLQAMALPGIGNNVKRAKLVTDRQDVLQSLPGIVVARFKDKTPPKEKGSNARDDIPYPVLIAVLNNNDGQDQYVDDETEANWNETIGSKFRNQYLDIASISGGGPVFDCDIVSDVPLDPTMFFKGTDAQVILLRFWSREARG